MNLRPILPVLLTCMLALRSTAAPETKPAPDSDEPSTPADIRQFNDDKLAVLSKQIAGKENQPSEAVFKNIKILTGIPAGNLLKIMQIGFSRSLGTSCVHCHVAGHWDKDDKMPKQIARDMWKMDHLIVSDLLTNIDGLKDRKPVINCTTCHRGQLKPALNLDADTATK
jgi:Photosynthetic reaction centre cytochrome C subunit